MNLEFRTPNAFGEKLVNAHGDVGWGIYGDPLRLMNQNDSVTPASIKINDQRSVEKPK